MRAWLMVAVATLLLAPSACKGKKEKPKPHITKRTKPAKIVVRKEIDYRPPYVLVSVKVVEPGESPVERRYQRPVNKLIEHRILTHLSVEETLNGKKEKIDLPPIRTALEMKIGAERSLFRGIPAFIDTKSQQQRVAAWAYLERRRDRVSRKAGMLYLSSTYQIGEIVPAFPDADIRREFAAILANNIITLPVEPIGIGGSWKVTYLLSNGGRETETVCSYTLKSMKGKLLEIEVATIETGKPQKLLSSDIPAEATAYLVDLRRTVKGTVLVDLHMPFPVSGTLTSSYLFKGKSSQGNETSTFESKISSTIELTSKIVDREIGKGDPPRDEPPRPFKRVDHN